MHDGNPKTLDMTIFDAKLESGYFGVSDVGKCVLLDSPACAEEACPLAVMVRGVDLPCGILLRDGAQRVSACAVHWYHRLAGHRWRRKQWLHPHRRSGTNKLTTSSQTIPPSKYTRRI